jgi:hypothetical protein
LKPRVQGQQQADHDQYCAVKKTMRVHYDLLSLELKDIGNRVAVYDSVKPLSPDDGAQTSSGEG